MEGGGSENIINTNKWRWDGQSSRFQKIRLSREQSKQLLTTYTNTTGKLYCSIITLRSNHLYLIDLLIKCFKQLDKQYILCSFFEFFLERGSDGWCQTQVAKINKRVGGRGGGLNKKQGWVGGLHTSNLELERKINSTKDITAGVITKYEINH